MKLNVAIMFWVVAFTLPGLLEAEMVYDNGGGGGGSAYFPHQSDSSTTELAADDVTFNIDTLINRIEWTGSYLNGTTPGTAPATEDFTISVYGDSGSGPGSLLQAFNVGNAVDRSASTDTIPGGGLDIYDYRADINFTMLANTTYWISISSNSMGTDKFHWGAVFSNTGANLNTSLNSGSTWIEYSMGSFGAHADFKLFNTTTIPEPATIALFGTAMLMLSRRRR